MRHVIRLNAILWFAMSGFVMSAYGQVSGQWKISVSTPVGADEAEFELKEDEGKIEGHYSGILGQYKPVKGTYKNDKLSLSFEGEWPSDGSLVEVKVTGQLSGDSGSGDVVVVNRTTGTWTGRRATQPEVSKLASSAPAKTEADDRERLDRFVGEWYVNAGAAQIVENAIHQATDSMGSIARGVARGRLNKIHAPPAWIRMRRQAEFFMIEFEGSPARTLPISGAEAQEGELRSRLQFVGGAGGGLRQIGETQEGKRENLYRIGNRPDLMTMEVTVTSPRLPSPLRYTLEFMRAQPSAPAAAPRQSQSNSNFSNRFVSRDRNAPRRDNLQSIQTFPHINGLIGGFEQGAGLGFGLELTTADKIPGIEVYARALGTTRLYRKVELGAIVGNKKARGEIWFSYLRRTRDNFFGIGPRTSEAIKTNYSVERRSFNATFSHKITNKLEAGVYSSVTNTGSFRGENDDDPSIDALFTGAPATADATRYLPGLNSNAKLFSFGIYAELDLRNNDRGLTRGGYFYGRFGSTDGLENNGAFSDYGWTETELDGRVYIPVFSDRTSLALRAYAELKEPKGGSQIPFYDLSWLGGRASLRGFEDYRFRGNNLALFSGEIRRTVLSRNENQGIDIFVFADYGQIWGDKRSNANPSIVANNSFESENWRVGAGGGVQFRMSKSMAFRFEVGGSNEKNRLYFSVSRGF